MAASNIMLFQQGKYFGVRKYLEVICTPLCIVIDPVSGCCFFLCMHISSFQCSHSETEVCTVTLH